MQAQAKKAMGYPAMDEPSKAAVDALLKQYIEVVGNPRLDRKGLDGALNQLNDQAANTEIYFPAMNWKGLIRHVPPQSTRDVFLGTSGTAWAGLRPAFDVFPKSAGG